MILFQHQIIIEKKTVLPITGIKPVILAFTWFTSATLFEY
jgi:hypothetical protein